MKKSWVSVIDGLPEMWDKSNYRSKKAIVTDGKEVWFTCYHVAGKRWMDSGLSWQGCITHWQYVLLPEN